MCTIEKIISGGQTGVDRAALDVAIKLDIPHGGWCPKGRLAEDGIIPKKYSLQETTSLDYSERTKLNIKDSDGTLVILPQKSYTMIGGTTLTVEEACNMGKPCLIVYISGFSNNKEVIKNWITENKIKILNIAGPRESQSKGIHDASFQLLEAILSQILLKQNTFPCSLF